jgi:hypothetical protein
MKLKKSIEKKLAESVNHVDAHSLRWIGLVLILSHVLYSAITSRSGNWLLQMISLKAKKIATWFDSETRKRRATSRRWLTIEKYWAYLNAVILYLYGAVIIALGIMYNNHFVVGAGILLYWFFGLLFQTIGDKANDALLL